MRTRRLHARLAYMKRADNRASVAFAAASTFARKPRPPRVAYAEASCRPRLRGKKRLEVGLRIACLAWLGTLAHMMRTRRLHASLQIFVLTYQWHGCSGINMFVDDATLSAACAWIDKIRPFESPQKVVCSVKRFSEERFL